jgi:3-oxoacyl-[acyl-carrier protein] reductase
MNALILGGSRGVGLAIAEKLGNICNKVCISSRNLENLAQATHHLRNLKAEIFSFQGNVADGQFASSLNLFLQTVGFGRLDILVCNAGGPPQKNLLDTNEQDWNNAIKTSLIGQINVVKSVLPAMMIQQFGRIIFISSTVVREPTPPMVLSATVRAGLSAFAKSIAVEFANQNITANVVLLGGVTTERLKSLIQQSAVLEGISFEEKRASLVSTIPIGRFAEPFEVANLVNFLVSAEGNYVTGQSIAIDGGLTRSVF